MHVESSTITRCGIQLSSLILRAVHRVLLREAKLTLPFKLAVFDCDGTIVDSQHSIMACMAAAFSDNGLQPPGIAEVRRVVGLPLAQAIEVIAPEGAPISAMAEAYSRHWSEARTRNALSEPLFPGILKVFEDLMSSGWLLGVATGKSMRGLEATLSHHDIASKFVTLTCPR